MGVHSGVYHSHYYMTPLRGAEPLVSAIAVLTALTVALPVVAIALLALQPVPDLWPHLVAYVLPQAMIDTTLLLAGAGAVTLLLGGGGAWLISRYDFPGRAMLVWLMPLPLAIPTYIAAYVYADLFEPLGLAHRALSLLLAPSDAMAMLPHLRSLPGAIFVFGIVLYPYVYLSARAMFQLQSAEFIEAAMTLGANRWDRLRRISLPMARPALAVGLALVSLETLNDIGASEYLGVQTMTLSIFTTWLNRGSLAGAAQISCFVLAIVAGLIAIERYGRRNTATEFAAESPRLRPRVMLKGSRGWYALAAGLVPVILGFLIPFAFLIRQSVLRGLFTRFDMTLWQHAWHSVMFASLATLIALALGFATTLTARWRPGTWASFATNVAQTGYALPGLVLALGLLAPVLAFDNGLNAFARMFALPLPGLVVMGSGAALVIAYTIRFLAIPTGFIKAAFERIPRDYDDSARAAGASQMVSVRRIHLPLLRPALLGAVIVVFVDCLKELPATLLLRPLNVETLATSIYQHASRGSFEDGALAALMIVAASIGPVVWLTRFSDMPQGPA